MDRIGTANSPFARKVRVLLMEKVIPTIGKYNYPSPSLETPEVCPPCEARGGYEFKEVSWRERHANLAGLFDRIHERPSFAGTIPPGL